MKVVCANILTQQSIQPLQSGIITHTIAAFIWGCRPPALVMPPNVCGAASASCTMLDVRALIGTCKLALAGEILSSTVSPSVLDFSGEDG